MIDNRVRLPERYILKNNGVEYQIAEEVGCGANSIVYNASYTDTAGHLHYARVKELYPVFLRIERGESYGLNCDESHIDKFNKVRERFETSYSTTVKFRNTYGVMNSTVNSIDKFNANETIYVVMNLDEGKDYQCYKDQSLEEVLIHVKSVASVIAKYHKDGYLHLDIKPENVFVIPETAEHVYLFDFDSVCTISDLKSKKIIDLSFSEGFSAPEQVQGNILEIGTRTDIYAIGALLFFKLFNRKPTFEDGRYSSKLDYKEMSFYDDRLRPAFFKELDTFFHKTLATSPSLRWEAMEQVIDSLEKLIKFSDLQSTYLVDTFSYSSANFVGRIDEIEDIYEKLQGNHVLFLSGIGGIGKTEIAKKFVLEYRNEFDTVAFVYFQESIEHTVCQEVLINNMSIDEEETEADYFERILDVLRKSTHAKDLVILDNFDVERDDRLEDLLKCPCTFLITTRNRNIRDWNYNEVKIDRMNNADDLWSLFETYNSNEYGDSENKYIEQLINLVDGHTMTVELISKYLRDSKQQPSVLYQQFMEKSGVTSTDDSLIVNHRKDHKMNSESVNEHLSILFDVFDFEVVSKEIMCSLSLFAGIRINRERFESFFEIETIASRIDHLINGGWIELNDNTGKISLHQVIQDLIYFKLNPTTESCPHVSLGMLSYIRENSGSFSESKTKRKVFEIFAGRISGDNIPYAEICLESGNENKINEAILICQRIATEEASSILVKLYMQNIRTLCQCDDMFDCDDPFEDYGQKQMMKIDEQFGLAIHACEKAYSNNSQNAVFELTKLAKKMDEQMSDLMVIGCFDDVEEVDSVYRRIIQVYDMIDESILDYAIPYDDKVTILETARDFYSDDDFYAMYRCENYSDYEKVDYYQELLNTLRQIKEEPEDDSFPTIKIFTGDKTHSELGDSYMSDGDYNAAIKMYKKAYDEDEEPLDWILPSLSKAYYKVGDIDSAVECLIEVLKYEKQGIEDGQALISYSGNSCLALVKLLIEAGRSEEAIDYAKELIAYLEPEMNAQEDNSHFLNDLLAANWYLYYLENDQDVKKRYWSNCLDLFGQLKEAEISEEQIGFLREYLNSNYVSYDDVMDTVKRFTPIYRNEDKKIALIDEIIHNRQEDKAFRQYQIQLLIYCAEIASTFPYKEADKALEYCKKAEELLAQIEENKEFFKNKILKVKAEAMANDMRYDFDEVNDVRKQCDYYFVAEQASLNLDDKKKIDIWTDSANKYGYVHDYENQMRCLEQAYAIMVPILNKYDYSRFDHHLWYIMNDMVIACISNSNLEKAVDVVSEMYTRTITYYKDKKDEKRECLYKMKKIADLYAQIGDTKNAYKGYLTWIYMSLDEKCEYRALENCFVSIGDIESVIKEIVEILTVTQVEDVDNLISFKEAMESINCNEQEMQLILPLLDLITIKYQNKDIEFK